LGESHKWNPWPLDESPRPKSDKLRLNQHGTTLEGKSIGSGRKKKLKSRACNLNQDASYIPRQCPTQGFNLLQRSSNWFLGIWTLDPHVKWALVLPVPD